MRCAKLMPMVKSTADVLLVSWITPGYVAGARRAFGNLPGGDRSQFPKQLPIADDFTPDAARMFGEALTTPADVLLVMTHGQLFGPGIAPSNRAGAWARPHTVADALMGRKVQARGVIDLACNRGKCSGEHTDWLAAGPNVEWQIAAEGGVSDRGSARAVDAATTFSPADLGSILAYLERYVPKSKWWSATR